MCKKSRALKPWFVALPGHRVLEAEAKEMPKLEELAHATEETLVDVLGFPEQELGAGSWKRFYIGVEVGKLQEILHLQE